MRGADHETLHEGLFVALKICNPVKHLDHAKREIVRCFDIPADAILNAAKSAGSS